MTYPAEYRNLPAHTQARVDKEVEKRLRDDDIWQTMKKSLEYAGQRGWQEDEERIDQLMHAAKMIEVQRVMNNPSLMKELQANGSIYG